MSIIDYQESQKISASGDWTFGSLRRYEREEEVEDDEDSEDDE